MVEEYSSILEIRGSFYSDLLPYLFLLFLTSQFCSPSLGLVAALFVLWVMRKHNSKSTLTQHLHHLGGLAGDYSSLEFTSEVWVHLTAYPPQTPLL